MNLRDKNRVLGADNVYETTVQRRACPPLLEDSEAEVLVIGGGLAGLSTALELAELGPRVMLLEAGALCSEASGRNGGQVLSGFACGAAWLQAKLGPETAQQLWALSVRSIERIRARLLTHAIDCGAVWSAITVADRPAKVRQLQAEAELLSQHFGQDAALVTGAAVRDWIDSPRYLAALPDPAAGHLNPLQYGLGLARACLHAGVRLHEHSPALRLERQGPHWWVHTAQHRVRARQVVLAGNCGRLWHSPGLWPAANARIMPVGTYLIATDPLPSDLATRLLPQRSAVCDNNFVLDYFRISPEQRLLFGGRVSYTTATPAALTASMHARMVRVFPDLATVPIAHTWGGFVDISRERAPDWASPAPGLFLLQGFSGHGLAATTLGAQVVAQAIRGDDQVLQAFARIRQAPFPGGPAWRVPLLVLGTLGLRVLDALGR